MYKDWNSSRSRGTSSVSRLGKSTHGFDHLYRPSPSPGPRDLGSALRVYNSNGTDLKMADVRSSSPVMARRTTNRCVEGNPKSTENNSPTGFEILSRQKVEHLEPDQQMQPTDWGVTKDPNSIEGKSFTESRLDCLDHCLIQV